MHTTQLAKALLFVLPLFSSIAYGSPLFGDDDDESSTTMSVTTSFAPNCHPHDHLGVHYCKCDNTANGDAHRVPLKTETKNGSQIATCHEDFISSITEDIGSHATEIATSVRNGANSIETEIDGHMTTIRESLASAIEPDATGEVSADSGASRLFKW
ncbi:MAG: hypothetical protein M1820_008376 [Bogoriella megaspora]|nr:MAG: hypothetical protein M1820_008376 [Bogoriella megaspora]